MRLSAFSVRADLLCGEKSTINTLRGRRQRPSLLWWRLVGGRLTCLPNTRCSEQHVTAVLLCHYNIYRHQHRVREREREMWPPAFRDGNVSGESNGESIQEEAVVQIGAKNYLETIQVQYSTVQYSTEVQCHQKPSESSTCENNIDKFKI